MPSMSAISSGEEATGDGEWSQGLGWITRWQCRRLGPNEAMAPAKANRDREGNKFKFLAIRCHLGACSSPTFSSPSSSVKNYEQKGRGAQTSKNPKINTQETNPGKQSQQSCCLHPTQVGLLIEESPLRLLSI